MNSIWESLGDEAASEWHVKWTELRRSAGLSVQASNTYSNLINKAAPLALEISSSLKKHASETISQSVELEPLTHPEAAARSVVGPLDQSVQTSLTQVAAEYEAQRGGVGIRLRDFGQIESEKVTRHLNALAMTLAKQMTQRAAQCQQNKAAELRAQGAEHRAQSADQRSKVLFWVNLVALVGGPILAFMGQLGPAIFLFVTALAALVFERRNRSDSI